MTIVLKSISTVVLDIEGTVAPISFVKDTLFPYFLEKFPSVVASYKFPISGNTIDPLSSILSQFPEDVTSSREKLIAYVKDLVTRDVKDSTLKSLQGYIWKNGYENGTIKAPVYPDALRAMELWSKKKSVYIYSSGSVKAQKLLFGHVDVNGVSSDINSYISGYFDIQTSGYKFEKSSYEKILQSIAAEGADVLFLSDNVREVRAAIEAGLRSIVVTRPGNAELTSEDKSSFKIIQTFDQLDI